MAKKKLTKRQIAARRAARKARLEAELADLEAEGAADLEDEDEDEDDDEGDWDEDDDYLPTRRGSTGLSGPVNVDGVIGMLGNVAASMSNMGVEDETAPDAEGNPGIKFQRHAGRVRNVKMGRDGQPLEVDFEPEEWPPRGEAF